MNRTIILFNEQPWSVQITDGTRSATEWCLKCTCHLYRSWKRRWKGLFWSQKWQKWSQLQVATRSKWLVCADMWLKLCVNFLKRTWENEQQKKSAVARILIHTFGRGSLNKEQQWCERWSSVFSRKKKYHSKCWTRSSSNLFRQRLLLFYLRPHLDLYLYKIFTFHGSLRYGRVMWSIILVRKKLFWLWTRRYYGMKVVLSVNTFGGFHQIYDASFC